MKYKLLFFIICLFELILSIPKCRFYRITNEDVFKLRVNIKISSKRQKKLVPKLPPTMFFIVYKIFCYILKNNKNQPTS